MKREDIQSKVKDGLKALNIIGIDQETLKQAKAEIDQTSPQQGVSFQSIPLRSIPLRNTPPHTTVKVVSNFIKVDADVLDKAFPIMDPYEQSVYRKLYRDSYGGNPPQSWCTIGYGALQKACNIKKTGVRNALDRLADKGWIEELEYDQSNSKTYRVYLPFENGFPDSKTRVEESGIPLKSIPLKNIPSESIPSEDTVSVPSEGIPSENTPRDKPASEQPSNAGVPLKGIPSGDILIRRSLIDLSPNSIVDLFYTGIGQEDISENEREKAFAIIEKLQSKGKRKYTLEEIAFAAEWITKSENRTEPIRTFGILPSIMGQAMRAKKAADKVRTEAARLSATEEEERRLQGEIQEMRSQMTEDELHELRERADKEIRESGEYKEQFITNMLITAKENEILQREKQVPTK